MTVAITGGTGFIGRHLARRLLEGGSEVRLLARGERELPADLASAPEVTQVVAPVTDRAALREAFEGCDAVAHLAGISFERGRQTFHAVHVEGTRCVVRAAETRGVSRVLLSSFLRARPACGSAYHETKWAAEEAVREADVEHTVLKLGLTYGRGDHLLSSVSRALLTAPVFPLVGRDPTPLAPLSVADAADVAASALLHGRLRDATVPVTGPEELSLAAAVRRIGGVIEREPRFVELPAQLHRAGAALQELVVERPLLSTAQVRMLEEGIVEPAPAGICEPLPGDLRPERGFDRERIADGLPDLRRLGPADLRWP